MLFLITILIGILGASIALKMKIPAGAMIGSLFAVAIFNIFTGNAHLPQSYKIITQISTGTFIGAKIKYEDIKGLKEIFFPAFLMVVLMALFNFLMGFFITSTTDIDITTALFATAPGGIADMSIIAYDFGADSSKVAVLQLIRLISVVSIIPMLIKFMIKKVNKNKKTINKNLENNLDTKNIIKKNKKEESFKILLKKVFITLFIGSVTGLLGFYLKVPAGTMSFAMTGTAIYNIFSNKAFMPIKLRQLIQVFAGALIGAKMTMGDIISLKDIAFPVLVIIIGFCAMNLILGILIYKITDFSVETALFSTSPGGMSDMAIIASELGADTPKVAVMQFLRVMSVIGIYPILIKIISNYI
ncbi:AbrB family transcriptional regulator [Fusobacterium sp.]|uniref:AbrB family transcriptional regulator n=1 Tax=Fusobacterium sp. TaxID=68766 RepID=UPI00262AB42E|nr:AbrB family transcriptional regulator [Fusobacterium sp.]